MEIENLNTMDRLEFCNLVKNAKKDSNVKTIDVCRIMNVLPDGITKFSNGKSKFLLSSLLIYLKIIGYYICLNNEEINKNIIDDSDFSSFLNNERGKIKKSFKSMAFDLKTSSSNIYNAENNKKSINIDNFLKISEYFGYNILIKKYE